MNILFSLFTRHIHSIISRRAAAALVTMVTLACCSGCGTASPQITQNYKYKQNVSTTEAIKYIRENWKSGANWAEQINSEGVNIVGDNLGLVSCDESGVEFKVQQILHKPPESEKVVTKKFAFSEVWKIQRFDDRSSDNINVSAFDRNGRCLCTWAFPKSNSTDAHFLSCLLALSPNVK